MYLFSAITENTFTGLSNLQYLFANDAGIVNIALQAFALTPNIQEIDLEDNLLTTVGAEFGSLQNLRELLLAQNKVRISLFFSSIFSLIRGVAFKKFRGKILEVKVTKIKKSISESRKAAHYFMIFVAKLRLSCFMSH